MILRYLGLLLLLVFFYKTRVGEALFVPEEVPSLVSFIYNNIPPIAKGPTTVQQCCPAKPKLPKVTTPNVKRFGGGNSKRKIPHAAGHDSRIGLGFRVGPNADFQMVFELGPQKETQPLVKVTGFTDDSEETRKRHIPKSLQYYAPAPHAAQVSDDEPMQVQHSGTPKGWLSAWKNAFSGGGKSVFGGGGSLFNGGGKSVLSGGKSSFNGGGTAFGKNGGGKSLNSLRRSEKKWELETNELRYPGYLPGGYFSKSYHRHQPLAESLQRFNGYPGKMNHATVNHLRQLYKEQPMK